MGLIIFSTVNQRRKSATHLDHRDIKVLSKRVRCQIDRLHIFCMVQQRVSTCLTRQIDIGSQSESEQVLIFAEIIYTDAVGHLHECIVAGIHQ